MTTVTARNENIQRLSQLDRWKVQNQNAAAAAAETKRASSVAQFENPFVLPKDDDIYHLEEKGPQKKERKKKELRAHEKSTYISRMRACDTSLVKNITKSVEDEMKRRNEEKKPTDWDLGVAKDRIVEKEGMQEYIDKKRELFFARFVTKAKEEEMKRLDSLARAERRDIELQQRQCKAKAIKFDAFLKSLDDESMKMMKQAEVQTNKKMQTQQDIKKLNAAIMAVTSEIQKHEDSLKEFQIYKKFLDSLAPREWKSEIRRLRDIRKGLIVPEEEKKEEKEEHSEKNEKNEKEKVEQNKNAVIEVDEDDLGDDEEAEFPDLYFTEPNQLLDILGDLEEQNLSLIQNSQETEESLDQMKANIMVQKQKMDEETNVLKQQIDTLEIGIQKESERARELEQRAAVFDVNSEHHKKTEEEKMMEKVDKRVAQLYSFCVGDSESNMTTMQMLTSIEVCLEDLLCFMERTPLEKIEAAEQVKEQQRKDALKRELLESGKKQAEERRRREIERQNADVKPKKGKQLVFRSNPPPSKAKKPNKQMKAAVQQEEEMNTYFKW